MKKVKKKTQRHIVKVVDVQEELERLSRVFAHAAVGDLSEPVPVPKDETFAGFHAGITILLETARTKIDESNRIRAEVETILKSIGEGLFVVDTHRRVIMVNDRALDMLGYKREKDVIGKHFEEVVTIEEANERPLPVHELPVSRSLDAGETSVAQTHLYYRKPKAKKRFAASMTTTPVVFEGNAKGAITVFRDITQEKNIEDAKTDFISLASHQLRTPLSIITLYLNMMRRYYDSLSERERKGYLLELQRATNRMTKLVDALLNASRIEMGALEPHYEEVNFTELVQQILDEIMRVTLETSNKEIVADFKSSPTGITMYSDSQLLRVVVDNLISNAVKYTPSKRKISVSLRETKNAIVFSVKDRGYGIPEGQKDKIFSKMFRAENVKKVSETGTGLGLYITKSIVGKLGGDIWFQSGEGRGTTFFVKLPKQALSGSMSAHQPDADQHSVHTS